MSTQTKHTSIKANLVHICMKSEIQGHTDRWVQLSAQGFLLVFVAHYFRSRGTNR